MSKLDQFIDKRHFIPVEKGEYIGDEERNAFNEKGYYVFRNLISAGEIEQLRKVALEEFANSKNPYWISAPERQHPLFREYFSSEEIGSIIRDLNGPSRMFLGFLVRKPPQDAHVKPWHQDGVYWGGNDQRVCAIFTPLTPFGRDNGSLYAVAGSHRLGRIYHWVEEENLLVCDISGLNEPECIEANPGDVIAMHSLTVHASIENRSQAYRINLGSHWSNTGFRIELDESTTRLNQNDKSGIIVEHI